MIKLHIETSKAYVDNCLHKQPGTKSCLFVGPFDANPAVSSKAACIRTAAQKTRFDGKLTVLTHDKTATPEVVTELIKERLSQHYYDHVMLFGITAHKAVFGTYYPALDVRNAYGFMHPDSTVQCHLFPDPFHVARNRFRAKWLIDDIITAMEAPERRPLSGEAYRVTEELVDQLCSTKDTVFDCETFGHQNNAEFRILTMAAAATGGHTVVYWTEDDLRPGSPGWQLARRYLTTCDLSGHNRKYDLYAVLAYFGVNRDTRCGGDDTYITARLLRSDTEAGLEPQSGRIGIVGHKIRAESNKHVAELALEAARKARVKEIVVSTKQELRVNKNNKTQKRTVPDITRPPTAAEADAQALAAVAKYKEKHPGCIYGADADWITASKRDDGVWSYYYALVDPYERDLYCCLDVLTTAHLLVLHRQELANEPEINAVYQEVIRYAPRAFVHIENTGLLVNMEGLRTFSAFIKKRTAEIYQELKQYGIPDDFNPGSSDQVADFLFEHLKLPKGKLTKGGKPSVSALALKPLKGKHPAVDLLREHSELDKLQSNYAEGLMAYIRDDDRIHATFNLVGAECLAEGELVLTNRGYIPVESVIVGDQVISHLGEAKSVTVAGFNGVKDCYLVETESGHSLVTTGNHPYLVKTSTRDIWVTADALTPGLELYTYGEAEEWRPVHFWPYEVSNWGRVRRLGGNPLKTQVKGTWGHRKVALTRNGSTIRGEDYKDFTVHSLVAATFVGDRPAKQVVRHLNGIAWDNTSTNLAYGTSKENFGDAVKHCTMLNRVSKQNKLTEAQVVLIRETPRSSKSDAVMASELGISREHIRDIRTGKKHQARIPENNKAVFATSKIVAVTRVGQRKTYGLTVADHHTHVTAGIVTHNTGRISCTDPNMQTIPSRGQYAKLAKALYIVPPGKRFMVFDYKTIEPMKAAELSGDQKMLEAFILGEDFHRRTAGFISQAVWGNPFSTCGLDEADPEFATKLAAEQKKRRVVAKECGLAVLYGQGVDSMAERAGCTVKEAEAAQEAIMGSYPQLRAWIKKCISLAQQTGYTWTYWNDKKARRRYVLDIGSTDGAERSHGERCAYNCVDDETEALTQRGWVKGFDLQKDDILLTKNKDTGQLEWQAMTSLKLWPNYVGDVVAFNSRSFSAVTTPNHRWLVKNKATGEDIEVTSETLSIWGDHRIHRTGNYCPGIVSVLTPDEAEALGWFVTDGTKTKAGRVQICQSLTGNPVKCERIDELFARLGGTSVYVNKSSIKYWCLPRVIGDKLLSLCPNRTLNVPALLKLDRICLDRLRESMILGDGTVGTKTSLSTGRKEQAEAFQILLCLTGNSSSIKLRDFTKHSPKKYNSMPNIPKATSCWYVTAHQRTQAQVTQHQKSVSNRACRVWCPIVPNTFFVARRLGNVYITGNTPVQGSSHEHLLMAACELVHWLESNGLETKLVLAVHDALYFEVPEHEVEEVGVKVIEVMCRYSSDKLKLVVEAESGPCLAELTPWTPKQS